MSEELNLEPQELEVQENILVTEELQEAPAPVIEEVVEEEVVEEVKEVKKPKAKPAKKENNKVRVRKIVQHLPSHYRLLVADGRVVKVHKSKYKQGQSYITLRK